MVLLPSELLSKGEERCPTDLLYQMDHPSLAVMVYLIHLLLFILFSLAEYGTDLTGGKKGEKERGKEKQRGRGTGKKGKKTKTNRISRQKIHISITWITC